MSKLNGYKTYIGMIAAGVYGIAIAAGWIEWEQTLWIAGLITAWTGVGVTHKVVKKVKG